MDLGPQDFFPSSNGILDLGVERVKLVKELDFLAGLLKSGVALVGKTEKGLTCEVGVVLSLPN